MNGGYFLQHLPSILLLVSITVVLTGLFGRPIVSKLKWGGSRLKWSSLRDASNWSSPSSDWLARWTGKWKGWANAYWVAGICVFALAGFATVPLKHFIEPAQTITAHWWYFVHVPQAMPDNEYIVLHLDRADLLYGTRSRYVFCAKGHRIDFDEGELLTDVVFKEHDDCKELLNYNFEKVEGNPSQVKHYSEEAFNHGHGR